MAQSFFIWKNKDCRSLGVRMRGAAPIIRAEERVNHVEIPGRSGDLTETEGSNIYNSYIQTVTISVTNGYRVREILKWLRGESYITFSGEPDRRQKARVIGAITLNRISRNMDHWAGEVQFYCQPYKELLTEKKVTITSSGASVNNAGDVNSRPMYKVTVSGSGSGKTVTLAASGDGTPEDNELTVTGLTGGSVIWIDADTMEVLNSDKTAMLTADSTGYFPELAPGANTVTGSGWSSVEIERRERFL